jgi:signal peptidase I
LKAQSDWRDYSEVIFVVVALALIVRIFVITSYRVQNDQMEPTFHRGELLVGFRVPFGVRLPFTTNKILSRWPKRGEIIAFKAPNLSSKDYLARVIALPGDRLETIKGRLVINQQEVEIRDTTGSDEKLTEKIEQLQWSIKKSSALDNFNAPPMVVPPGRFYVLTDSRDLGPEGNFWDAVSVEDVEASIVGIWYSRDQNGRVRWERIFN